jgi:hypothetical protein
MVELFALRNGKIGAVEIGSEWTSQRREAKKVGEGNVVNPTLRKVCEGWGT